MLSALHPGMKLVTTAGATLPPAPRHRADLPRGLLLRPLCDRRILLLPRGRKIDVILPRHDLRERDHQRRQGNADHRLRGQADGPGPLPGRRADPPSAGLERVLHRDDAPVRASRLSRDLRQPLRARGRRQRRQSGRRRRQGARRRRHRRRADGRRHRGRREVDARAARSQRQGRPVRLLLGRPARLHLCLPEEGRRCLRRPLGRPRGDGQGGAQCQDAGRADRHDEGPRPARCSACSATTTARRAPSR